MKKEEKRERKKGGDLYLSRADVFFGNLSRKVRESVFLSSVSALFRRFRGAVNRKNGKADDKEPSLLRRARRTATAEFERSVLVTGLRNLGRMILSAKLRTLGILLLSFGVWSVSADLLLTLFLGNGRISFERTWFSVAASLTSLPMLFCGSRSVGRSVLQSRILHFLLFDLLGLPEAPFREAGAREGGGFTAFLMGLFFGAATLFISPLRLAAALGIFLCLLISLLMPESGFLLLLGALPFTQTKYLFAGLLFIFACFLLKAVRGKRSFRYGPFSFLLTVYALLVLFGVLFPSSEAASAAEGWERFLSVLAALLAMQMARSSKDALRFSGMIVFSSVAASLCGLFLCFSGNVETVLASLDFSFENVQAFLPGMSPEALACFLAMAFAFLPAFVGCLPAGGRRALLLCVSLGLTGLCLLFTWSLPCLACAFAALLLLLYLRKKAAAAALLFTGAAGGLALFATGLYRRIPFLYRLTGSLPGRLENAEGYLRTAFSGNPLTGAGSGVSAPFALYLKYGDPGAGELTPGASMYMQVLSENGIIGLLFFLIPLLFLLFYCGYVRKINIHYTDPYARWMLRGGGSFLGVMTVGGFFINPLASSSGALCFFCLLGVTAGLASSLAETGAEGMSEDRIDAVLVYRKKRRKNRERRADEG